MDDETPEDGRRARTRASKHAVATAMLALMREHGEIPTADDVAQRAGMSRRSVFRLFEDLPTLSRAAIETMRAEVLERFPPPMPGPSVRDPMAALVQHRASVYEFIMPVRTIAQRRRAEEPAVEADLQRSRLEFRMHLELLLGPLAPREAKARDRVLHAVEALTSWATWRVLRQEQGCSTTDAQAVVLGSVRALLAQPS